MLNWFSSDQTCDDIPSIKAGWHGNIIDSVLKAFYENISMAQVEVFDVPGAFELTLMA